MGNQQQGNRRVILINRPFQLRFAFYVCSWLIVLSFAYPLIISNLTEQFLRYLAVDPHGPALTSVQKARDELFLLVLTMQASLIGLAFLISIFMSHKIAGPLVRLRRFMKEAGSGNLEQQLKFREKDYFQELANEYNQMMNGIRSRISRRDRGADLAIQLLQKIKDTADPATQQDIESTLQALRQSQEN